MGGFPGAPACPALPSCLQCLQRQHIQMTAVPVGFCSCPIERRRSATSRRRRVPGGRRGSASTTTRPPARGGSARRRCTPQQRSSSRLRARRAIAHRNICSDERSSEMPCHATLSRRVRARRAGALAGHPRRPPPQGPVQVAPGRIQRRPVLRPGAREMLRLAILAPLGLCCARRVAPSSADAPGSLSRPSDVRLSPRLTPTPSCSTRCRTTAP